MARSAKRSAIRRRPALSLNCPHAHELGLHVRNVAVEIIVRNDSGAFAAIVKDDVHGITASVDDEPVVHVHKFRLSRAACHCDYAKSVRARCHRHVVSEMLPTALQGHIRFRILAGDPDIKRHVELDCVADVCRQASA